MLLAVSNHQLYVSFSRTNISNWAWISHKWARLLKQQSLITAYRLLTKENKLPFSISVCG
jgi:hypothetical protein